MCIRDSECTGGMFGANRVSAATTEMLIEGNIAGASAAKYSAEAGSELSLIHICQIVGGTDADGNIQAESLILAKVPENGLLGEVSDGIWIYYLPEGTSLPEHVRAELYRVDDAETLEGQRTVSSSLTITVPEQLPELELDPGSGPAAGNCLLYTSAPSGLRYGRL